MKIIHVSAECYPIAKVGGLADVVGALPKYQNANDNQAQVIMPFYDNEFTAKHKFRTVYSGKLQLGQEKMTFKIVTPRKSMGCDIFLVDIPNLLFKKYVYSENDTERFIAFQVALLDWISTWETLPDLVHCHDHHTGLTPFMMTQCFKYESLKSIPTVLTIHNAQYQGWFSHKLLHLLPLFHFSHVGLLDWDGVVNPLAAAIKCAWRVTTVSPSYMEELKQDANGLEQLLSHEAAKCVGILNGIDADVWNPETDKYIIKNYKNTSVQSGRKANKKWLTDKFDLDPTKPMFAFIGRLVGEKGSDVFYKTFKAALKKGDKTILLLGSGHKETELEMEQLKGEFPGLYNAFIGYDERLSHIIYAGTDYLLMPSRVEPCGLNQMYALRYGGIPIVRSIGGLKDTVIDIEEEDGFGFCHANVDATEINQTMQRAVTLYQDQTQFRSIRKKIMKIDHSWHSSAASYISLYKSLK